MAGKVAIIGGGASGLAAAIACAREMQKRGCGEVVLYEATDRVGRSILASGNGRCNFSAVQVNAKSYHNGAFVQQVFEALQAEMAGAEALGWRPSAESCVALQAEKASVENGFWAVGASAGNSPECEGFAAGEAARAERQGRVAVPQGDDAVHAFFAEAGLSWRAEADGRLYPRTNKASTVLDVLRAAAAAAGVRARCGARVRTLVVPDVRCRAYTLQMADGSFERADAVLVCAGGAAARGLLPAEVPWTASRPMLGPLAVRERCVRNLDNLRVRAAVTLLRNGENQVAREEGELLFRKYGVSGICVFNLSRLAQEGDVLRIDLLPELADGEAAAFARQRRSLLARTATRPLSLNDFFRGLVLPRIADEVLARLGSAGEAACDEACACAAIEALKHFDLTVAGIGDEAQCQVHRGGLDVKACDALTLQLIGFPGLFAAGELLDVDGPCGGYNLHWAWASGLLAGRNAARCVAEEGGAPC